jgi:predicted NACHT family NTPase
MAINRIYNWERFWCPRGGSILLTSEGFLYDAGKYNKDIFTFDSIAHHPCLILLGEPGIGKSNVLRAEWQRLKATVEKEGDRTVWLDLRSFGSEDRLVSSLFGSTEFIEWQNGDHHLHLFLDSLDECLLRIDTVATLLIDELRKYPVQRLSLRIASRSAEWPTAFEDGIRELWGSEAVGVYELTQLRRDDVDIAARTEGIADSAAFLREVTEKNAGPLAAKPVTLQLLLNLWLKDQHLPETQAELYERGCRLLCEEEKPGLKRALSAAEKMVVASRIAAVTVFANRFEVWTAVDRGDRPEEDVTVLDLCGATERTSVRQFEVTEKAVKETLDTGLFSLRGANRLGWAHQTYAEFLAALYLKHLNLDPAKIIPLITHAQDPEGRIPPQLHEVSAWIAGMFPEIFHHLIRTDTMVLLRSDVASADASARSQLTAALLRLFAEEKERDHWEIRKHYHKLKHSDLAGQLRPVINDRDQPVIARRAAIDIAEECRIAELQNELAGIALDESENLIIRIQAAAAAGEIGDSATQACLKPLALGLAGNDPEDELRGYGLIAVWPEHIAAEELFSALVAPNDWYSGSYWVFLSQHLLKHLKPTDLPTALRWVENQGTRRELGYSFGKTVDEILVLAWHYLDEPGVLESFARVALKRLKVYEEIVEDHFQNELLKVFVGNDEKRRRVLKATFSLVDDPEEEWVGFVHSSVFSVSDKDTLWLLEMLLTSAQPKEHLLLVRLIDRTIGNGEIPHDILSAIQAVCEVQPLLAALIESRFKVVELGSREAARMKESWEDMMTWRQRRESRKEEFPLLEPPPAERIDHLLDKFESGDLDAWWRLNLEMTLEPHSTHYGSEFESDLTKLPGWMSADAQTRERIIAAARKYLLEGDPNTSEWQGTNTMYRPAYAGYRAFLLLLRFDPDFISRLPEVVWRNWVPIIAAYPVFSGIDGKEEAIHRRVTALAYQKAPDNVIESLIIEINRASVNSEYFRVPDKFVDCWDEQFKKALREKIREWNFRPESVGNLLGQLLEHGDQQTQDYAESLIASPLPTEGNARKFALIAARELMRNCASTSWSLMWAAIQQDTEFGRSTIESLADNPYNRGIPACLTEEAQADLYIWLARQYPHHEDPDTRGVHFVGAREAIAQWRDSILQHLKERGTSQSLTAIEKIQRELPELDWLKWVLNEARNNMRRHTWVPLQPQDIIALKEGQPSSHKSEIRLGVMKSEERNSLIWNSKPIGENPALRDFLDLYKRNHDRVVPFVGAGVSRPLFPSWEHLLKMMIKKCADLGKLNYDPDELLRKVEQGIGFLDIAECCVGALGEPGYRDLIQEHFDQDFTREKIPPAYQALLDLKFCTILTTNYDRIPERGSNGEYRPFTHQTAAEACRARIENKKIVMKMHGDVSNQSSIILTRSDYDRIIFSLPGIKDFLHGILGTKTLLFIGFGLTDPHLEHLLSGLKSINSSNPLTHYALMSGLSKFELDAKERNFGIRIIKYEPSDNTHPEVLQFIRLLAQT